MPPPSRVVDTKAATQGRLEILDELKELFILGDEHFIKPLSVDRLVTPPASHRVQPFHPALYERMCVLFSEVLHMPKIMLTVMPLMETRPSSWKEVAISDFYIINGQHTCITARNLIQDPAIDIDRKNCLKVRNCNFVYSKKTHLLVRLAERMNITNSVLKYDPDVMLFLRHAREEWIVAGSPRPIVMGAQAVTTDARAHAYFVRGILNPKIALASI